MNNDKGFSLLEILVAFSILAVSLSILLQIFSTGVNTAIVAEEYTIATQIAESLMAKVGVEEAMVVGEKSGVENDKYHWQLLIEDAQRNDQVIDQDGMIQMLDIKVNVQWGEGSNARNVELNTLKSGQIDER